MKTFVFEVLGQHGLADVFLREEEVHLRLENRPYMPLVIERVGSIVSVAHYSELNGDAMRDPETTFDFATWEALSFQNDYAGSYQAVFEEATPNLRLRTELNRFSGTWAQNLRAQGFARPDVVQAGSLSHANLVQAAAARRAAEAEPAPDAHLEDAYDSAAELDADAALDDGRYDDDPSPYAGDYSED